MRLGALLGAIGSPENKKHIAEEIRVYAAEGFESLWAAQSIGRGAMLPDPFTTLSVAATLTDDIELGTAILQVPLYHPVDLAHRVFSLMQITGDRLILGVGSGSNQLDFGALDRDYEGRFNAFHSAMDSFRELMQTGKRGGANLTPWDCVLGGPRIFYGTWGKGIARAISDYDGWIASGHYRKPKEVVETARTYKRAGGERAMVSTIHVNQNTDLGELRETLELYREVGFDDAVFRVFPGSPHPSKIRRLID